MHVLCTQNARFIVKQIITHTIGTQVAHTGLGRRVTQLVEQSIQQGESVFFMYLTSKV